ncbi:hypothetical protein LB467_08535 [Salegentibacter sp. JZCK2]|uniref:hypothetical protein n=1 Tax=Salegentibacter tibetensis TaxID=2873600 RepID=UPI001CCDBF91|nr:hypothetical protein [Salegentibacter tibetensis]MBZ9729735.1 hypothetical protein [Salegentibacter tibetensis]
MQYLKKVIEALLEIDSRIDIYIYTNKKILLYKNIPNINLKIFTYRKSLISRFSKKSFLDKIGIKWFIHPFYLAWENRNYIERMVDDYDIQIYLEDDIEFKKENFEYWLKFNKKALSNNYKLGFFRHEIDKKNRRLLTDVTRPLTEIIELEGQKFLLNRHNPYCGFWIMDKKELKAFIKSPEWKLEFDAYGIREKAAIGWHGKNMNRYKGTIVPLLEDTEGYITPHEATVHHLPNNYVGRGSFCSIEFPLRYSEV